MTMIKAGVYVHIPFCLKKCAYCDFLSHRPRSLEVNEYMEALAKEIERFKVEGQTLFIGGGTPSIVPPSLMERLIKKLDKQYGPFLEATIEVNPGTVDLNYLKMLYDLGIDRLSIGVQSFDDDTLKKMGRIHSSNEAQEAVLKACEVGFTNISIDLIYGYPQTTIKTLEETLKTAISLPISHVSFYGLQLEEGTELMKERPQMLSDKEYVGMYYRGMEVLEASGFMQYEISNFAKPDFECKHNLIYWKNLEYLGLGVGAVSRLGKVRYKNIESVLTYVKSIEDGARTLLVEEQLTAPVILKENIMLGLRLKEGIGPNELGGFSLDDLYPEAVALLSGAGYLEQFNQLGVNRYRLTKKALPVMNSVLSYFF
ncbi:MAG: radical SAM family heme chaperone HemW [Bacillota bacterium]